MKKFYLSILLFVVFSTNSNAQQPCLSDEILEQTLLNNPEARERLEQFNADAASSRQTLTTPNTLITIPVVVYVFYGNFHNIGEEENITDAQVMSQITALNNNFAAYGIQFCLATRAGNTTNIPGYGAQPTPGILHIGDLQATNHVSTNQQALLNYVHPWVTRDKYLRIFVVKSINGATSGVRGYASFPNFGSGFDGIVMQYKVFGDVNSGCESCDLLPQLNQGKVLVHEVGHYLSLYHTFQGGCPGASGDCTTVGDRVCDTPPVASPNWVCHEGFNSCEENGDLPDSIHNFMDYGDNNCVFEFTPGQKDRMYNALTYFRSTLFSMENLDYTGSCGSDDFISAQFSTSNHSPCQGTAVQFEIPDFGDGDTYAWDFGDPASGNNTANISNPSHTFNTASDEPYTVTLTVTNNGISALHSTRIFVSACNPIQNAQSRWYFGKNHLLNFNSGVPVFEPIIPAHEDLGNCSATQSDAQGNLLFYTNKQTVWDKTHSVISPPGQLVDNMNYSQIANPVLIVPKPGDDSKYYIFTSTNIFAFTDNGLHYNVVNVDGNGQATVGATRQPVNFPTGLGYETNLDDGAVYGGDAVVAIKSCTGYWIVTILRKPGPNQSYNYFLAVYALTDAATNDLTFVSEFPISRIHAVSKIEVAPNGNKVFLHNVNASNGNYKNVLLDFNKMTGEFSNPIELVAQTNNSGVGYALGASFSPDSKLLYIANLSGRNIYQFDATAANINSTKVEVAKYRAGFTGFYVTGMQIGPDGKIYLSDQNSNQLKVIHRPNSRCSIDEPNACYFSLDGPKDPFSATTSLALPNMIEGLEETVFDGTINATSINCNTMKFFPNVCWDGHTWDFGDPISGVDNTSTASNPVHLFATGGEHTVLLKDAGNNVVGQLLVNIGAISATILGNSTACLESETLSLTNNSVALEQGQTASWNITGGIGVMSGMNNQSDVTVVWSELPGTISLTITDTSGCTATATQSITSDCSGLSVGDFEKGLSNLVVHPNPAESLVNITFDAEQSGIAEIIIQSVDGKILMRQSLKVLSGRQTLEMALPANIQSGIVLFDIKLPDFRAIKKVVIK